MLYALHLSLNALYRDKIHLKKSHRCHISLGLRRDRESRDEPRLILEHVTDETRGFSRFLSHDTLRDGRVRNVN
jgi:hypothetical protein